MKIIAETQRSSDLILQLIDVWESAVRNTHSFLTEADIKYFKDLLPDILKQVPHLLVAYNDQRQPIGFAGINKTEIAMLFITQNYRKQGLGKQLIKLAVTNYQADKITVNTQNPEAVGFYEHIGFVTYRQQSTDDSGRPFPVLKMRLAPEK